MVEEEMVTVLTVLSERPPTEPIERPCPPEQVPPVKVMEVPEFMARQSSWLTLRHVSLNIIKKKAQLTCWHQRW
jgi:hypothetical protein